MAKTFNKLVRDKIPDIPEFGALKKDPAFLELLAENPKPL